MKDALAAVERDWPDTHEKFTATFRILLERHKKPFGTDPWGQPCVYRVDREKRWIYLNSVGRNGQDDEDDDERDDDIEVAMRFSRPGEKSSADDELAVANESTEPSTIRLPLFAGVTLFALVGVFFGLPYLAAIVGGLNAIAVSLAGKPQKTANNAPG